MATKNRKRSALDLSLSVSLGDVPSDPVIVEALTYDHGAGGTARRILDGASLRVAVGEVVVVAGAPGAGKSTLLTLIAGLRTPQAGRVCVLGEELTGAAPRVRRRLRHRVAFVAQSAPTTCGSAEQLAALEEALAAEPALLLADDPTAGLDERVRASVGDRLLHFAREHGVAILIASADPALLAVADRVLRLEHGRLEGCAEPERTTIVYRHTA